MRDREHVVDRERVTVEDHRGRHRRKSRDDLGSEEGGACPS
jgi:hypothetical protein